MGNQLKWQSARLACGKYRDRYPDSPMKHSFFFLVTTTIFAISEVLCFFLFVRCCNSFLLLSFFLFVRSLPQKPKQIPLTISAKSCDCIAAVHFTGTYLQGRSPIYVIILRTSLKLSFSFMSVLSVYFLVKGINRTPHMMIQQIP